MNPSLGKRKRGNTQFANTQYSFFGLAYNNTLQILSYLNDQAVCNLSQANRYLWQLTQDERERHKLHKLLGGDYGANYTKLTHDTRSYPVLYSEYIQHISVLAKYLSKFLNINESSNHTLEDNDTCEIWVVIAQKWQTLKEGIVPLVTILQELFKNSKKPASELANWIMPRPYFNYRYSYTLLQWMCIIGDAPSVRFLLEQDADINYCQKSQYPHETLEHTALYFALNGLTFKQSEENIQATPEEIREIVDILLCDNNFKIDPYARDSILELMFDEYIDLPFESIQLLIDNYQPQDLNYILMEALNCYTSSSNHLIPKVHQKILQTINYILSLNPAAADDLSGEFMAELTKANQEIELCEFPSLFCRV